MRSEVYDGGFIGQAIKKLIREGRRKRWPMWHSVLDMVLAVGWYVTILAAFTWLIVILI